MNESFRNQSRWPKAKMHNNLVEGRGELTKVVNIIILSFLLCFYKAKDYA